MNIDAFPGRLKQVIGEASVNKFAKLCEVSESLLRQYLSGKSTPGIDKALKIAIAADVSVEWLITGEGSMREGEPTPDALESHLVRPGGHAPVKRKSGFVYIPIHDVSASAGNGGLVDTENILDFMGMREEWVRAELQVNPANLSIISVRGESMVPTLKPGELIVVDRGDVLEISDGIFVLNMEETLLVKRIQRLPGKVLEVVSDNTSYKTFTIDLKHPPLDFKIIGRVICALKRL